MLARHRLTAARDDRGAQTVEFALIASFVLLPLVLGIINLSYVFGQQLALNQAAREGARKAVVSSTADAADVGLFVVSSTGGLITDTAKITVTSSTQNQLSGTTDFSTKANDDGDIVPTFPAVGETCGTNPTYNRLGGQLQVTAKYPAKWLVPTFIPLDPPNLNATAVFRCEAI